ncbi:MAG: hypothetical protein JST78_11870 [Bacteroidetes bacterium]|nr:hypothetical protein [Bacteroidota bacterium]
MKKLYAILSFALLFFSCSDTDEFDQNNAAAKQPIRSVTALDPTKLAKVVIWPGIQYAEKHFYFYPNGLIKKITEPNGTLVKDFVYDGNQDLIIMHYNYGGTIYTSTFAYDSSHRVTSINGYPVGYDAVQNRYVISYTPTPAPPDDPECPGCYDDLIEHSINLSDEYLATYDYFTYEEYFPGETPYRYYEHGIYAGYSSAHNMTFNGNWTDPSNGLYSHDQKVNPLKAAMLPLLRALAANGYDSSTRMADPMFHSANNVIYLDTQVDQETEQYVFEFNAYDLPKKSTANSYYHGNFESSHVKALYYYQGDVIP